MKMIDVPAVEKEAYNPDRPISGLIQMQLIHLSTAEQMLPPNVRRTGINIATLHTEGQAAEYIQKVTALLHRAGKAKKKKTAKTKKSASKPRKSAKNPAAKSGKGRKTAKARK
ncbi:MAG TPA: hypothetical protein VGK21_14560 [Candidatus Angelobacter sp.]|jgi:hypothetical protein